MILCWEVFLCFISPLRNEAKTRRQAGKCQLDYSLWQANSTILYRPDFIGNYAYYGVEQLLKYRQRPTVLNYERFRHSFILCL